MLNRVLLLVALVSVSACHGITYPTQPAAAVVVPVATAVQLVAGPPELPIGGGVSTIRVEVLAGGGGFKDAHVALTASTGELEAESVVTDVTGHGEVVWHGDRTGVITATFGELIGTTTVKVLVPFVPPPNNPPPPPPPFPQPPFPPEPPPVPNPPAPPAPATPTLNLSANPSSIQAGSSTTVTATVSNLPAGEVVLAYEWDWTADGNVDDTTTSGSNAHVYPTSGVTTAKATARTSTARTVSGTTQIVVTTGAPPPPQPPAPKPLAVSLTVSNGPYTTLTNVTFTATVTTNDPAGVPSGLTYAWDFNNDGVVDSFSPSPTTTRYQSPGDKTVKVTVTAPDGRSASNTITITVS